MVGRLWHEQSHFYLFRGLCHFAGRLIMFESMTIVLLHVHTTMDYSL